MTLISRRNIFKSTAGLGAALAAPSAAEGLLDPAPQAPARSHDSWNIALIAGSRPELSASENEARYWAVKGRLKTYGLGVEEVRGKYLMPSGLSVGPIEIRAHLVWGREDDSGNLKGHVRKLAREFEHSAVIIKGYYRSAILHSLRDNADLALKDGDTQDIGRFRPECLGAYVAFLCGIRPTVADIQSIQPDSRRTDDGGGRWLEIAGYHSPTMLNCGSRMTFDDNGVAIVAPYGSPRGFGPPRLE